MKLILEEEQKGLQEMVRQLVEEQADSRAVRATLGSEAEYDSSLWAQFAELGLLGIVIPEEFGGAGAGAVERSIVVEELGRRVVPTPFLASAVLATDVLLAAEDQPLRTDLLGRLASGESIGAVAVAERDIVWSTEGLTTQAKCVDGSWTVDGTKTCVVSGMVADFLLVLASSESGPAWFVIDPNQAGVRRDPLSTLDPTRPISRVEFSGAEATRLEVEDVQKMTEHVRSQATVALSAESVGGHAQALDMTVEYAKVRMQFGRPIGSFQAVKHGLADVFSSLEMAQSVVRYAAWAAAEAPEELPLAAALAHSYVPGAFFKAAFTAIHFHGGIGFTAEHDAQFYFKRAKSNELLFGNSADRLDTLADCLAI